MNKGKLITLYGINNMGKTTQARILVDHLEGLGHKVKYVKYPVYDISPTGPFINSVIRHPEKQSISEDELQLWYVLNRYQYQPKLREFLSEGYIVVAEDYSGTGIAWGMAKGLKEEWMEQMNEYLVKEDLAILIEGKRILNAKEKHHVHEQNDELMEKCAVVHSYLAEKYGWRRVQLQPSIEATSKLIWDIVDGFLM